MKGYAAVSARQTMDHLVEVFGSQNAVAEVCGVRKSAVSLWRRSGIPLRRRFQLLEAAGRNGLPVDRALLLGPEVTKHIGGEG